MQFLIWMFVPMIYYITNYLIILEELGNKINMQGIGWEVEASNSSSLRGRGRLECIHGFKLAS